MEIRFRRALKLSQGGTEYGERSPKRERKQGGFVSVSFSSETESTFLTVVIPEPPDISFTIAFDEAKNSR